MDPLSATASVIAVIQITSQALSLCQTYFQGVKSARKDIKRLRDEVTAFQDVLAGVADLADAPDSAQLSNLHLLTKPGGLVQRCRADLEDLVARLQAGMGKDEKMKQFGLRALKWPFSSKEVDRELVVLSRYKETFALALTTDLATLAISVKHCAAELKQDITEARHDILAIRADLAAHKTDSDHDNIIQWLSTSDPSFNHEKACQKHEPATGEWLFKCIDFQKWKSTRSSLLWLHGKPGCGKTILSSAIIERLIAEYGSVPAAAVAYFYFDFADIAKQRPSDFVSSVIVQLCHRVSKLPDALHNLFRGCNNGNRKPSLRELFTVFPVFAKHKDLADIFLVVDALEECSHDENNTRKELLELLNTVLSLPTSNIHILVTSRPEIDIKEALEAIRMILSVPLQGAGVEADINLHIEKQLATDEKFKCWSNEIKSEIKKILTAGANGMFRWVFCQLDALRKCKKATSVRKALTSLPKTLDDTYARILRNISEEYRDDARRALTWIAFSKRPLLLREVAEAAVFGGDAGFDEEDRFQNPADVLEVLGSLVTCSLEDQSTPDPSLDDLEKFSQDEGEILDSWNKTFLNRLPRAESVSVSLAHYSVKEYLMSDRIIHSDFEISENDANAIITESCLKYIHQYEISATKTASEEDLRYFPLLYYACEFWYVHLQGIPIESQKPLRSLLAKLFDSESELASWLRIHRPDRWWLPPFNDGNKDVSPLYHASSIGLVYIVQRLLDEGADVNTAAEDLASAFLVAAGFGHEAVVRILLQFPIDINMKDEDGATALHVAAEYENEGILRALLQHKADTDAVDTVGNTALHYVAWSSNQSIVQLLLEYNADVNVQNMNGQTPLYLATKYRNTAMVHLLLQTKLVNINTRTDRGETALELAVSHRSRDIVGMLLAHKADLDHTLFPLLINFMDESTVLPRLDQLADINIKGPDGGTALHEAAYKGNEELLRLLILRGADTNMKDHAGDTPLIRTAGFVNRGGIIRLLVKHNANINSQNDIGYTALHRAADSGTEATVRELLALGADVRIRDVSQSTALHVAIEHEAVAQLLLDHRAEIDAQDGDKKTALHKAAQRGFESTVRILLDYKADVSIEDEDGRTALYETCGNREIAQLLLEHGADVNAQDHCQRTALHNAAFQGHDAVVKTLLEHKASVRLESWNGRTPLHEAAFRGGEAILRMLLKHKADVNRVSRSGGGGTALHIAAYEGHEMAVKLLLETMVNKHTPNLYVSTALHSAVYKGHASIVRLLLDFKADINAKDKYGRTPLHCASEWGKEDMRQLLLELGANPRKDRKGGLRREGGKMARMEEPTAGDGDNDAGEGKPEHDARFAF